MDSMILPTAAIALLVPYSGQGAGTLAAERTGETIAKATVPLVGVYDCVRASLAPGSFPEAVVGPYL
jgi:hypothetical protein